MSTRLQVVLDDDELAEIRRVAGAQHRTVSDWVRETLRAARREYPTADAGRKIAVVREAIRHDYPTADVDRMLREVEQGYSAGNET
jgi:hypothetical protein